MTASYALYWIPLLPLLGALFNLTLGHRSPRWLVHFVACATVGASCVIAVDAIAGPLWDLYKSWKDGGGRGEGPAVVSQVYTWIQSGNFKVDLRFVLDPLAAVMVFTITFVGFLIHLYSTGYMAHDRRYAAYFGYLNLFTGAMLILVLGDSLPVLFIGWEGVGLCSYLLIGFWFDKEANANAGRKAFVVNRIGDFAFLIGIFLLFWSVGSVDYAGLGSASSAPKLAAHWMGMPVAFWAGLFLFIGACGKSAQIPLYVWLPDAMAGPTPVSALIHAATMVTAGVYMVARLNFVYMAAPEVLMIVAGIGAATALFAALIGFAQNDIKKVLAYSTVSQLGFMFVGVGTGMFNTGIFHLFTHAFFKAGLFLGAGSVMHAMGDRTDIQIMGGLRKKTPFTHLAFLVYCLAIAGLPPFSGFFSKDEILIAAYSADLAGWPAWYGKMLWIVLTAAATGTSFYMWRLYFLVFWGESRAPAEVKSHIHESPAVMWVPLMVLAAFTLIIGFLGWPHQWGHAPSFIPQLADWLRPSLFRGEVYDTPNGTAWMVMAIATVLGAVGIAIAYFMYKDGPEGARKYTDALGGLRRAASNKFYVDEVFDVLLVRPFRWAATAIYNVIDRFIIDLIFVNGSAFVVSTTGRVARAFQNGDMQRYLLFMVLGLAAIVFFAARDTAGLRVNRLGDSTRARLVAEVDTGGALGRAAKVRWDLDGDGKADPEHDGKREITYDFGAPGEYKVTLWVADGIFGGESKLKKTVKVGGGAP